MNKTKKITYWIVTAWLCLGMSVSGIMQLLQVPQEIKELEHLGYPSYFLSMVGAWKLLGVVTVLLPALPLLKEWAYAGFFFTMSGAIVSHLVSADPATAYFGPVLLIILTIISWYLRPAGRTLVSLSPTIKT